MQRQSSSIEEDRCVRRESQRFLTVDLTPCYEKSLCKSLHRNLQLDSNQDSLAQQRIEHILCP